MDIDALSPDSGPDARRAIPATDVLLALSELAVAAERLGRPAVKAVLTAS
jgi:Selenocysteine synthase N terminal